MKCNNLQTLLSLTGTIILLLFFTQCNKETTILKKLQQDVNIASRELPRQLDDLICLDSMEVIAPKSLKTYYTVNGMEADLFYRLRFDTIHRRILLYNLQAEKDFSYFKRNDVIFIYAYQDKDGNPLAEMTLTSDDYKMPVAKPEMDFFFWLSENEVESLLKNIAANLNSQISTNPANHTNMIGVAAEGNKLIYTYRVENNSEIWYRTSEEQKEYIINYIKGDGMQTDPIFYANAIFRFIYLDAYGEIVHTFDIPAEEFRY